MRSFVIRSRKGVSDPKKIEARVGAREHFEIVAHVLANTFFYSNGMREDVELFIVLDSSSDFPKTLRIFWHPQLSLPGFDETSLIGFISTALKDSSKVKKDEVLGISPGVELCGFGFDRLAQNLLETRAVYLLDPKGEDIRSQDIEENPVFLLSDHLPMPKKSIQGLERKGLKKIGLGKRMLFASQCVVLVHDELDRHG